MITFPIFYKEYPKFATKTKIILMSIQETLPISIHVKEKSLKISCYCPLKSVRV